jgi:hypothetical protein
MAGAGESHVRETGGGSRGWRKLGIVLAILLALFFLPWLFLSVTGRAAVRNRVALMKAAGEPTSLAEYEARRPVIPDEENSALVILELAAEMEGPDIAADIKKNLPLLGKAKLPRWGEPWPPEMLAATKDYLAEQAELVARLDAIHDMPRGRFPLDVTGNPLDLISDMLSDRAALRGAAKVQALAALRDAAEGDVNGALARCRTIMNMASSVRDDPMLISSLVSISIDAVTVQTIERVLAAGSTEPELANATQALLRDHELSSAFPNGIKGERLWQIAMHGYARERGFEAFRDGTGPRPTLPAGGRYLFGGWLNLNQAKMMDLMDPLIETLGNPREALTAARQLEKDVAELSLWHTVTKVALPSLSRAVTHWVRHVALLRCAQAGLAAERFRMAEGRWPESLDELVPEYIDAVPLDPFDEQPLRYKVEADRIVIYSISENEVDDGGDLTKPTKRRESSPDEGFRLLNPELRGFKIEQAE